VPAEAVEAGRDQGAVVADRERRRRALGAGWLARVASQAGHAEDAVVELVVWLQLGVVERPVVADAVERAGAEVRGVEAREVAAPDDRAPADAAVHQRRDRGGGVVERVVLAPAADVRVGAEVGQPAQLPVRLEGCLGLEPAALLEAGDPEAGLGQAPGDRGPGGAGADDQDVGVGVVWHGAGF
jgi:hypothetical protein